MKIYYLVLFIIVLVHNGNESLVLSTNGNVRLPITCMPNMFTVELGPINILGQSINVHYRLGLNGIFDLVMYRLIDYINVCMHYVLFWARSQSTFRITTANYSIRSSDNVNDYLSYTITDLDALSNYQLSVGYQMKEPVNNQFFPDSRILQTCFDSPSNPINMTLNLFLNASYLIRWSDPPLVYNSQPICFYIVEIRYQNSPNPIQMEVTDRYISII